MKRLRKLRENKKGFTLVEVIVVMVIIAIMAAVMIPSLTGYIAKANDSAAVAEARSVLIAMQTEASENNLVLDNTTLTNANRNAVAALSEQAITAAELTAITINASNKVTNFTYITSRGATVIYDTTPAGNRDVFFVQ